MRNEAIRPRVHHVRWGNFRISVERHIATRAGKGKAPHSLAVLTVQRAMRGASLRKRVLHIVPAARVANTRRTIARAKAMVLGVQRFARLAQLALTGCGWGVHAVPLALRANSAMLQRLAVVRHAIRAPQVASPGAVPHHATRARLATAHPRKVGLQRVPSVQQADTCISIPMAVEAFVQIASLYRHVRSALSDADAAMVRAKDRGIV